MLRLNSRSNSDDEDVDDDVLDVVKVDLVACGCRDDYNTLGYPDIWLLGVGYDAP